MLGSMEQTESETYYKGLHYFRNIGNARPVALGCGLSTPTRDYRAASRDPRIPGPLRFTKMAVVTLAPLRPRIRHLNRPEWEMRSYENSRRHQ